MKTSNCNITGLQAKKIRKSLGLTQEELGTLVGKTKQTIISREQSASLSREASLALKHVKLLITFDLLG